MTASLSSKTFVVPAATGASIPPTYLCSRYSFEPVYSDWNDTCGDVSTVHVTSGNITTMHIRIVNYTINEHSVVLPCTVNAAS